MNSPKFAFMLSLFMILSVFGCGQGQSHRESLLTATPHVEDSIIYNVPQTARLCDNMKIDKRSVDIGDCKLYCEIEGEGIPLVLVHGGPGGTHHCFHPWLTGAKDKFKTIYYDQRGCGLSDFTAGEGYSFEQTVDDLERLRKALHIDRWIVLGHSYGGAVAQYYTIKYPQHVLGQILVCAVPMMNNPELEATNDTWFLNEQEKQRINEIEGMVATGKLTVAQYFFNNDINGGWKRQNFFKPARERQAQMATFDIVFDKALNLDFGLYEFTHAFDKCPIPTLLCEGKYDSIWSSKKAALLKANHPNATFVLFNESSHNLYSDEPDRFLRIVSEWADSLNPVESEDLVAWKSHTDKLLEGQITLIQGNKAFIKMIREQGVAAARRFYENLKKAHPQQTVFLESTLNILGYEYLGINDFDTAVAVFELNAEEYPRSWNAFDSLGEAYMKAGRNELAIKSYERSLKLNPSSGSGIAALKALRK